MSRVIIDVREPDEFAEDHVEGAINIPPQKLISNPPELQALDKDDEIILYCVSGSRSNVSMQYLNELGYTNLINGINKDHVRANYS